MRAGAGGGSVWAANAVPFGLLGEGCDNQCCLPPRGRNPARHNTSRWTSPYVQSVRSRMKHEPCHVPSFRVHFALGANKQADCSGSGNGFEGLRSAGEEQSLKKVSPAPQASPPASRISRRFSSESSCGRKGSTQPRTSPVTRSIRKTACATAWFCDTGHTTGKRRNDRRTSDASASAAPRQCERAGYGDAMLAALTLPS